MRGIETKKVEGLKPKSKLRIASDSGQILNLAPATANNFFRTLTLANDFFQAQTSLEYGQLRDLASDPF